MKKIFFSFVMMLLFSCSSHTKNTTNMDSMNAIDDHKLQDTTVTPNPNGYAPPNAKTDTSEQTKDSIRKRNGH